MSTAPRLQTMTASGARLRAVLDEWPAIVGLALVCAGVYQLAGLAWAFIAAGAPLLAAYALRAMLRRRRPR